LCTVILDVTYIYLSNEICYFLNVSPTVREISAHRLSSAVSVERTLSVVNRLACCTLQFEACSLSWNGAFHKPISLPSKRTVEWKRVIQRSACCTVCCILMNLLKACCLPRLRVARGRNIKNTTHKEKNSYNCIASSNCTVVAVS
jgi:hypothetical protein